MIQIMLCDDHSMVREGFAEIVNKFVDCQICAQAKNGEEAIQLFEKGIIPDIILLDISMPPGMSGLEVAKIIQLKFSKIKVIGLSSFIHLKTIAAMITYGASGFLSKGSNPKRLKFAIQQVMSGKTYYEPYFSEDENFQYYPQNFKTVTTISLTKRELEIAFLMSTDKAYKEIADELKISPNTVENIRIRIFEKTGTKTRTEAVLLLISTGYIHLS
jgi:two-component system response regulator NreC